MRSRKRMSGGLVNGKGHASSGVHYPALPCRGSTEPYAPNLVSKSAKKSTVIHEYSETQLLPKELRSKRFLLPIHFCEGHKKNNYLVLSPYAGQDAMTVKEYLKFLRKNEMVDVMYYNDLIKAIRALRVDVLAMNEANFRHNDVKQSNVMYDPKTKTAYLIDFGLFQYGSGSIAAKINGQFGDVQNLDSMIRNIDTQYRKNAVLYLKS